MYPASLGRGERADYAFALRLTMLRSNDVSSIATPTPIAIKASIVTSEFPLVSGSIKAVVPASTDPAPVDSYICYPLLTL